jgi:WhiB family redox-sensing transcriptional regulator
VTRRRSFAVKAAPRYDPTPDLSGYLPVELEWQRDALCSQTDPEAFYPDKGSSPSAAKTVCMACPVRQACLDWAIDTYEPFGVWGGMTERQRKNERGRRSRAAEAKRVAA